MAAARDRRQRPADRPTRRGRCASRSTDQASGSTASSPPSALTRVIASTALTGAIGRPWLASSRQRVTVQVKALASSARPIRASTAAIAARR
jgi:hypothetical protein